MTHHAARAFWSRYHELPTRIQDQAEKQFALLQTDPLHPSLHFKKVRVRNGREFWSARVTQNYRALAIRTNDGFLWFWIGDHAADDHLLA